MDELKEQSAPTMTEQSNGQTTKLETPPTSPISNNQPSAPVPVSATPTQPPAPVQTNAPKTRPASTPKAPSVAILAATIIVVLLIVVAYYAYTKSK